MQPELGKEPPAKSRCLEIHVKFPRFPRTCIYTLCMEMGGECVRWRWRARAHTRSAYNVKKKNHPACTYSMKNK